MWNTCAASPKDTSTARSSAGGEPPIGWSLHEEIQQRRPLASTGHEHVSTGAEPSQQLLGHERRQHRSHSRIDRIAAFSQHLSARLRSQRMPSGDDPLFSCAHSSEA
jgi:hypothetical protein